MNICGVLSLRNTSSFGNDNLLLLLHKLHYDTLSGIYTICYWIVDVSINIRIRNLITENVALNKPAGQQYTYGWERSVLLTVKNLICLLLEDSVRYQEADNQQRIGG